MSSAPRDPNGPDLPPPSAWHYRIEGNQKVFFACSPVYGALDTGPVPKVLCVDLSSPLSQSRHKRREKHAPQVLFQRHLGRYLLRPIPVRLSASYLFHLANAAEALRPPARRRVKTFADASLNAELFPDLALRFGSETSLVELKPKSGTLSRSALVHPKIAGALQKFSIPPYFFKNYLFPDGVEEPGKLPDQQQRYDPIKMLYGKDIGAQLMILHAEKSRGLRLFGNGIVRDHAGDLHDCNDGFCDTVLDVAAKALVDIPLSGDTCLRSLRIIQNHDYIDNIGAGLLLQRLMEHVGKSRAYEMIDEFVYQDQTHVLQTEDEEEFLESKRIVSYESSDEARRLHSHERYSRATEEVQRMRPWVCARMLADFMQAAAARDCSVMISMCPEDQAAYKHRNMASSEEQFGFVYHGSRRWLYCVHVVDVGVKNVDKVLNKWSAMDFKRKHQIFLAGGLDKLL